jgi:hypothetical protein
VSRDAEFGELALAAFHVGDAAESVAAGDERGVIARPVRGVHERLLRPVLGGDVGPVQNAEAGILQANLQLAVILGLERGEPAANLSDCLGAGEKEMRRDVALVRFAHRAGMTGDEAERIALAAEDALVNLALARNAPGEFLLAFDQVAGNEGRVSSVNAKSSSSETK